MKVVKIMGGLGNQMFQYAYGRNLELKGEKIIFDASFFHGHRASGDTAREFELDKFALLTRAEFSPRRYVGSDWINKIKRKLGCRMSLDYPSEKYFIDIADAIRQEFVLKKGLSAAAKEILKQIEAVNSVSMHIRRGDYVLNKKTSAHHGVCDLNYYLSAIQKMKEKVANPVFFVFSDDPKWAKENFKGNEFVFVSSLMIEDIEDMILMSRCHHHIIANSSFSWWGAWLSNNPEKIIIAPKLWLNAPKSGMEDIIPESWIKL